MVLDLGRSVHLSTKSESDSQSELLTQGQFQTKCSRSVSKLQMQANT